MDLPSLTCAWCGSKDSLSDECCISPKTYQGSLGIYCYNRATNRRYYIHWENGERVYDPPVDPSTLPWFYLPKREDTQEEKRQKKKLGDVSFLDKLETYYRSRGCFKALKRPSPRPRKRLLPKDPSGEPPACSGSIAEHPQQK